jgi:hypothetical protein
MGTTLTGTEIKDTYDSLIKVTDNGPISGTLKTLNAMVWVTTQPCRFQRLLLLSQELWQ